MAAGFGRGEDDGGNTFSQNEMMKKMVFLIPESVSKAKCESSLRLSSQCAHPLQPRTWDPLCYQKWGLRVRSKPQRKRKVCGFAVFITIIYKFVHHVGIQRLELHLSLMITILTTKSWPSLLTRRSVQILRSGYKPSLPTHKTLIVNSNTSLHILYG